MMLTLDSNLPPNIDWDLIENLLRQWQQEKFGRDELTEDQQLIASCEDFFALLQFKNWWHLAAREQEQLVSVSSRAGIGKTHLIQSVNHNLHYMGKI